jgi:hypothetical protein
MLQEELGIIKMLAVILSIIISNDGVPASVTKTVFSLA